MDFFEIERIFEREPKLIKLSSEKVIFVGDTHGDYEATQRIIERYFKPFNIIVFLGDYVDRGPDSKKNIDTLLKLKLEYPDRIYLLMGNHEGIKATKFYPADFWDSLDNHDFELYSRILSKLPFAATTENGIIALHGALPQVEEIEEINQIKFGDPLWYQIVWGDWVEADKEFLGNDPFSGRPTFGRRWFEKIMGKIRKDVLVRSHQPTIKEAIFGNRCLTLFTSSAYRLYRPQRKIAIVDLQREIKDVDDIRIEVI